MTPSLVEIDGVNKAFGGVQAVNDVSLNLDPGEVVAVLGHNGAGKSTLMKMLAGAYPIDLGEIRLAGAKVAIANPADSQALGIETIHQTLALADNLDAVANLFLGRELMTPWRTLDDYAMEAAARKVFAQLNPNFRNIRVPVRALSGGQRQAVAIGRAIYWNAKVLIMDEPTAALGVPEQRKVMALIQRLKTQNVAVIFISHNLGDIFAVADRILVLRRGVKAGERRIGETDGDEIVKLMVGG